MVTQGKVLSGSMSLGDPYSPSTYSCVSPTSTKPASKPKEVASALPDCRRSSSPRQLPRSCGGANQESSMKIHTSYGVALPESTTSPDQAGDSPILSSFNIPKTSMNWSPHNWSEKQRHADQAWMENLYEDSQDPWIPYMSGMTTPTASERSTPVMESIQLPLPDFDDMSPLRIYIVCNKHKKARFLRHPKNHIFV
ncbi:hypothetical protein [Human circovirus VS6600022]|uniref:Uncharacterized protein n=1 Tax=Human circovirus VS6600022 TaxID=1525173 RepID=A0A0A0Q923_9VIRU|nr:hypothetical protein [Human circovirus VS6600022]AIG71983.1 hypothetical protein [Human circovirus VS6600022]